MLRSRRALACGSDVSQLLYSRCTMLFGGCVEVDRQESFGWANYQRVETRVPGGRIASVSLTKRLQEMGPSRLCSTPARFSTPCKTERSICSFCFRIVWQTPRFSRSRALETNLLPISPFLFRLRFFLFFHQTSVKTSARTYFFFLFF